MSGAGRGIKPEVIETIDEVWWEVRRDNRYSRDALCCHNPEHRIPAGEECVEVARCWPDDGGTGRMTFRFCVEHAPEHIERIRSMEAGRFRGRSPGASC